MGTSSIIHDDGVAEIVMDNPPVNALTVAGWFGLADLLVELGRNPRVRVVVLRAEGRGFNAGGSPTAAAADASPRFSEAIIRLNLLAPLHVAQAANRVMQGQDGGGAIVNVSSVSGLRPSPGTAAYGAAKAGLLNLTQTLAVEWAPKVRVNAVSAGLVATDDSLDHYGGQDGLARVAATVPSGRFGTPADVADAVVFLAGPLSTYATGANLVLHGGGEWPAFLRAAER